MVGVGFAFTAPVALPNFGHRIAFRAQYERVEAVTLIQQVSVESLGLGLGLAKIEGPGLSYHERDRFGIFSRSAFELRFLLSLGEFQQMGFVEPACVTYQDGKPMGLLQPSDAGRAVCADAVNYCVDLHTVAFGTAWLPHITLDDLFNISVMNWTQPDSPQLISIIAGTSSTHSFIFRPDGYPGDDPSRVQSFLGQFPLQLWEELFVIAQRDLVTGDLRSGMIHACLGFETFVRHLLTLNSDKAKDARFADKTLKNLCIKPGCLPSLIGYSLNSGRCAPDIRASYERITALRDQLLHNGALAYQWETEGKRQSIAIRNEQGAWEHLKLALDLVDAVGTLVGSHGHNSGLRGMHRCAWNERLPQVGAP